VERHGFRVLPPGPSRVFWRPCAKY
jgi:hypothetical protein